MKITEVRSEDNSLPLLVYVHCGPIITAYDALYKPLRTRTSLPHGQQPFRRIAHSRTHAERRTHWWTEQGGNRSSQGRTHVVGYRCCVCARETKTSCQSR